MRDVSRYHWTLAALHWALAFFIIAALALGVLVLAKMSNADPQKLEALKSHMSGGLVILALMLVRLFIRTRTSHPKTANTGNGALDFVAWVSHRAFYGLVIAMAGSGLFMGLESGAFSVVFAGHGTLPPDFWAYPVRGVHYLVSRLLIGLIALHVAGALFHTFILRDGLVKRMGFGRRVTAPATVSASKLQEVRS